MVRMHNLLEEYTGVQGDYLKGSVSVLCERQGPRFREPPRVQCAGLPLGLHHVLAVAPHSTSTFLIHNQKAYLTFQSTLMLG